MAMTTVLQYQGRALAEKWMVAYSANRLCQVSVSMGASDISILEEFVIPSMRTSMSKSSLSSCKQKVSSDCTP